MGHTEHLLVFDERETAEAVADGLDHHTYAVRVLREALAGDDDAEDAQWLVHLTDARDLPDGERVAERRRLADLAEQNDGWYDDAGLDTGPDTDLDASLDAGRVG